MANRSRSASFIRREIAALCRSASAYLSPEMMWPRAPRLSDWRWISLDQVDDLAFSGADHKVIAALRDAVAEGMAPPDSPDE